MDRWSHSGPSVTSPGVPKPHGLCFHVSWLPPGCQTPLEKFCPVNFHSSCVACCLADPCVF